MRPVKDYSILCPECGFVFVSKRSTSVFCSRSCNRRYHGKRKDMTCMWAKANTPEANAKKVHRGEDHPRFVPVGTRRVWEYADGRNSRATVKTENGWELEHRVVTQAPSGLVVHHKDGDPMNNAPDNLEVITQSEHAALHMPERVRDALGRLT